MSELLDYKLQDGVGLITLDDGDKNVMSPKMLKALNKAFDQAEEDRAVVLLTGREGIFSAGFDLKAFKAGPVVSLGMINTGFAMLTRMLSFRTPIVVACSGHSIAMGSFITLSGDYRIGVEGPYKIVTNEVAIGLPVPRTLVEVSRQRLAHPHFVRSVMLAEPYSPEDAVVAGFIDRVASPENLMQEAMEVALGYTQLDLDMHYKTKKIARKDLIKTLKWANFTDRFALIGQGLKVRKKGKK